MMKFTLLFVCLTVLQLPALQAASKLTFDTSGKPTELVLGGADFLNSESSGFKLSYTEGEAVRDIPLNQLAIAGDKIKVSYANGAPSFIFQIQAYDQHVAIHLLDVQGIGAGRDYSLQLVLDSKEIAAYTLNDLMTANTGNRRRKHTELNWPYLWGKARPNGTHGSVVLYDGNLSGRERDAALAEIWSVQGTAGHMVRPAGQTSWTEADVMAWVDLWEKKFSSISKVSVGAETPEELIEMTETYVIPSGANRVYMFSKIWRAGGQSMIAPHPKLFPNGKSDLIAYSDYLAKHGINLQLKSLSPQINSNYEKYISSDFVDERIMRWASGTLVEDVDKDDSTIRFRLEKLVFDKEFDAVMRVGDELIKAKRVKKTEDGMWVLEGCRRGYGGSRAMSHKADAEMVGCLEINGAFNFKDDFGLTNSIAEEICGEYGDFLNDVNVGHLHFDGTGRMGQYPWYVRDFTDYVYSRVNQPTTGSRVGGNLPAHFEHQFSAAQAISASTGYRDIRIGPRLYQAGRKHTEFSVSMLDLHFDVMDGVRLGSRRPAFLGGQSGASLSLDTLKHYGLTDYAFQLFQYWVELAPVYEDADAEYVASFMFKERGHHYEGEDVLVLSKNGDGDYMYTPHRVMGRTSGEDEPFKIDQEWGAVPRSQKIKTGTTMELLNPYKAQEPQVVIYVEADSTALQNPLIKLNGEGELAVAGVIEPNETMKFEGGDTVKVCDNNWNLLRTLPVTTKAFTVNQGPNSVTTSAGNGSEPADLNVQYITLGPVYILETNKHLSAGRF